MATRLTHCARGNTVGQYMAFHWGDGQIWGAHIDGSVLVDVAVDERNFAFSDVNTSTLPAERV